MWIVRLALRRPYTFIVLAIVILILGPLVILNTPTDIFPNIDIPVVAAIWQYSGLSPEEITGRIINNHERTMTLVVSDIEHLESQTVTGKSVEKVFFRPGARVDLAMSQIIAVNDSALRQSPAGTTPPFMLTYSASSVPILQLALSSDTLGEQQLYDLAVNFLRVRLATVQGASIPNAYGGRQRQVQVDLNLPALQSKGLAPADVVNAIGNQNLILPTGTFKLGGFEYVVGMNGSPLSVAEVNNFPVKQIGGTTIYVRDVANVRDGSPPQTNIVHVNGKRSSLLTIMKTGNASTLDIVKQIKAALPQAQASLPPELQVHLLADQSLFVTAAIQGVLREGIIAACLTALMILIFIGSWRSTIIIAVSIPLSILVSIITMSALGETINIMTLGGLALAVGILVDDATVEIENINRNLAMGKEPERAILDGAQQIAVPAFVSTICICIVFVPMFFLTGVARFLFVPLAEAVVFAMLASYLLSRTLVPTMAKYLLRGQDLHIPGHTPSRNPLQRLFDLFERGFERLRGSYSRTLAYCLLHTKLFAFGFLAFCLASFALIPWLGQDFFPTVDSGQIRFHLRARTGTRIEETARICGDVEDLIRRTIPPSEFDSVLDNIGLPYSSVNLSYSDALPIGAGDADILVQLKKDHRPTAQYVHDLRSKFADAFPGVLFYFLPADMVSQILNFGLPAPIDVQVSGNNANLDANRAFANQLLAKLRTVPGTADMRIHQVFDQPEVLVDADRTKESEVGVTHKDAATSLLLALSGSLQTSPSFWMDPKNGVSYSVVAQAPEYQVGSLGAVQNIPVTGAAGKPSQIIGNLSSLRLRGTQAVVSHYNVQPVLDIFGGVQDRDLGAVATDIQRIVKESQKDLPRGSQVVIRGQIDTMQSSYHGLLIGLVVSITLVYLLIVVNFQSWLDPFIIISALPAALAGIVWFLFITKTTLSVPALTGSIMCMGVATANSILVVSFAKERLLAGSTAADSVLAAAFTRFRPVLMTALAMIIGMFPMALGLGEGGEQNAPLGRAVIGGLLLATVSTLFFVPTVFSWIHGSRDLRNLDATE